MTQPQNLEFLLLTGDVGEACRRLALPLRSVLSARARQMHLPAHLVEDAIQETCLRVLLYHGRFDPTRGSAWTWVQTIAVRALIDLATYFRDALLVAADAGVVRRNHPDMAKPVAAMAKHDH